jgi:hypothetical protein
MYDPMDRRSIFARHPASVRPTRGPSFIGDMVMLMPIADAPSYQNAIALTMH